MDLTHVLCNHDPSTMCMYYVLKGVIHTIHHSVKINKSFPWKKLHKIRFLSKQNNFCSTLIITSNFNWFGDNNQRNGIDKVEIIVSKSNQSNKKQKAIFRKTFQIAHCQLKMLFTFALHMFSLFKIIVKHRVNKMFALTQRFR